MAMLIINGLMLIMNDGDIDFVRFVAMLLMNGGVFYDWWRF